MSAIILRTTQNIYNFHMYQQWTQPSHYVIRLIKYFTRGYWLMIRDPSVTDAGADEQDAQIQNKENKTWVNPFFCDNLNWGAYILSKELNLDQDSSYQKFFPKLKLFCPT
jgi:hypothetical protein